MVNNSANQTNRTFINVRDKADNRSKQAPKEKDLTNKSTKREISDPIQLQEGTKKNSRNLQINTDIQKLQSNMSPKNATNMEDQVKNELSSLDTACMIPENGSFIECGEETKEEPKSPVTALINYDAKPCDTNTMINGDLAKN